METQVAGYVKLAKLWERNRKQAIAYQNEYYRKIYTDNDFFTLVGVYVDITGRKEIKNRPEMIRLLTDCTNGQIDQIVVQTKGYLAANTREFCYLIKFLFELPHRVDILSFDADYHIDTLSDTDNQRAELYRMAEEYSKLNPGVYPVWKSEIIKSIKQQTESENNNG